MAGNEGDRPGQETDCSSPGCCAGPNRRTFLQLVGLSAAASLAPLGSVMAGPFEARDFDRLVPADKKLDAHWIESLFTRGEATLYHGKALDKIGMPVGGLCAGQLYLGGDGRLWHWDIFNRELHTNESHYADPPAPSAPLDQGFAVRWRSGGTDQVRTLDRQGFPDIRFRGEYPLGFVEYRAADAPVEVMLETFSPFIPLNTDESSLPATVLRFRVKNVSEQALEAELAGWLENAVCLDSGQASKGLRRNRIVRDQEVLLLHCSAESLPDSGKKVRPPVVFADFEGDTYGDWKVEGEAFGKGPSRGAGPNQHLSGFQGKGLVNTWNGSDAPQGRLTSPPFPIERSHINFLIGGGRHPGRTCVNLLVDGQIVRTATGKDSDALEWVAWNVSDLEGKTGRIEIVDAESGGWGHIDVDQIEFADEPRTSNLPLEHQHDFGTLALALLEPAATDRGLASVRVGSTAEQVLEADAPSTRPFGQKLLGALVRPLKLEPRQEAVVTFVVAWHFPNLSLAGTRLAANLGRHYATRFRSAEEVARHIARHFQRLHEETTLWHRTWYEGTLPHWFLERTFANTSILATSTCHRFRNGRFYGWEGVGCCAGTCTHVWHYAQAVARLFPDLERGTREHVDYEPGVGFDPRTGIISHRAEEPVGPAVDGQAGTILRVYREHQMSADAAFLKRLWPRVRKSLEYLIGQDGNSDGILEGPQHNTLDAEWFGPVAWLSGLYLAALRAGEEMAGEVGDEEFAGRCRKIFEVGRKALVERLWTGEYFIQLADPKHRDRVGSYDGCEIDQVFGQHWAFQVGLGRVLPEKETRQALAALWKYNFTPDVGPYRAAHKPGRWYAMPGEAGLLMCTWPKGEGQRVSQGFDFYFNECMNGFEYQAAGHMLWEGLVQEGLAVTRAVHDRYTALRRNPWNEVECGDHYARSMASYGVFLAACGFEYHGPAGRIGFAPRLTPDNFRAAFTAAEGWGTFSQQRREVSQRQSIEVRWGRLRLRTLRFEVAERLRPGKVSVTVAGKEVAARLSATGNKVEITLVAETVVEVGQTLTVEIA